LTAHGNLLDGEHLRGAEAGVPRAVCGAPAASAARPSASAAVLARLLGTLVVEIDHASVDVSSVDLPSYPGKPRPTSTVTLHGGGLCGRGENVAFAERSHVAFAALVARDVGAMRASIAELAAALRRRWVSPYDRAALEAAAIDLALRQRGESLARAAGAAEIVARDVRYVVSFGRLREPLAVLGRERLRSDRIEFKLDVDPAWTPATFSELAALGAVAVLDFKRSGTPLEHVQAHRALPDALIEDPLAGVEAWPRALRRRLSFDAALTTASALSALPVQPFAINLKPARMGGVLEALACAGLAEEQSIALYLGGMFEVGAGRRQLRALAALLCPDAPNDIAPIDQATRRAERPARLPVDPESSGFGGDA